MSESFDEIRANAAGNATVLLRLHRSLWTIYKATDRPKRKLMISQQLSLLEDLMEQTIDSNYNVARMRRSLE